MTEKQTRLTKTLRDAWVKALRSGDYTQGTGQLHRPDGSYCCFGVLLRVAGYTDEDIGERTTIGMGNQTLEEDLCGPGRAGEENRVRLEGMNDGHRFPKASFSEIADWIEQNIPGVEL